MNTVLLIASRSWKFDPQRLNEHALLDKEHAPLGILYLATYLSKYGYEVVCIDERFENPSNYIDNHADELLCIGLSAFSASYSSTKKTLDFLKKRHPQIPRIIGGPHASAAAEETIQDGFDIAVIGEGETILHQVIEAIRTFGRVGYRAQLDQIQSIAYRDENGKIHQNHRSSLIENLDDLPFPDYRFVEKYSLTSYEAVMMTSRGCPGKCIFCHSGPQLFGRKIRQRSVDNVLSELRQRLEQGISNIVFLDDCLLWNAEWINHFCNRILEENLSFNWICETRVQFIEEAILKKVILAGCRGLNIGVESGSDRSLRYLKKSQTADSIRKAFYVLNRYGMRNSCYIIMGCPDETTDDLEKTAELIRDIQPSQIIVSRLSPIYGSELYDELKTSNTKINIDEQEYYDCKYPIQLTHLSEKDLDNFEIQFYRNMYTSGIIPEMLNCRAILFDETIPDLIEQGKRYSATIRVKNLSNFNWLAYPIPEEIDIRNLSFYRGHPFHRQMQGRQVGLWLCWQNLHGETVHIETGGYLLGHVKKNHYGMYFLTFTAPAGHALLQAKLVPAFTDTSESFENFGFNSFPRTVKLVQGENIKATETSSFLTNKGDYSRKVKQHLEALLGPEKPQKILLLRSCGLKQFMTILPCFTQWAGQHRIDVLCQQDTLSHLSKQSDIGTCITYQGGPMAAENISEEILTDLTAVYDWIFTPLGPMQLDSYSHIFSLVRELAPRQAGLIYFSGTIDTTSPEAIHASR